MKRPFITAVVITLALAATSFATEPNETFATSTVLSPGVLSVADELVLPNFPDTMLGIRDHFGQVYYVDDDSSHLGDERASAAYVVPTNSGSIDFSVSGYPDDTFDGFHSESGYYEVFVDVYDFFEDLVAEFSEVRLLQPGVVHDFFYSDFEWINGTYDVYIDNTVGTGDIDFFTFTGLSPGTAFSARTLDPLGSDVDTYLGWFGSDGTLLTTDDDSGGGLLSLIDGSVPANGMLTFAVTGFGDDNFAGDHGEFGTYELQLDLDAGLPGDFNDDNSVNAADYVTWRNSGGSVAEYNTWRAHFGETGGGGATGVAASQSAVPEPVGSGLAVVGVIVVVLFGRHASMHSLAGH